MSSQLTEQFNQRLLQFLKASPTPFHCVANMIERLLSEGFSQLKESDNWQLTPGKGYFVSRNDSSIIAFRLANKPIIDNGVLLFGAHTDSPCLKLKPKPDVHRNQYHQLGVEVYGGALLAPWFDRDLSLAGRVTFAKNQQLSTALIDFKEPIATIPSLAIHLFRDVNTKNPINAQQHLVPIIGQISESEPKVQGAELAGSGSIDAILRRQLSKQKIEADTIFEHELLFYDTQPPSLVGLNKEFIASARLDNLLSCFTGIEALLDADGEQTVMLVCSDHEEVGSQSAAGAGGPMLEQCLQRIIPNDELRFRVLDKSFMVSTDNAHGIHPNYADKHDSNHLPILNQGPVIKVNANQRYATNSVTSSQFELACQKASVPVQKFVMRSDMGCGSTIGPITAANLGISVVDVGVPTFGMHSIRETAGSKDAYWLYKALVALSIH